MYKLFAAALFSLLTATAGAQIILTVDNIKGNARENYMAAYITKNFERSDSLVKLAVQEKPNFIDGWILLGDNKFREKQYDEAARAYEKVKSLKEDYVYDINLRLAKSYIGAEKYQDALSHARSFQQLEKLGASDRMNVEKLIADCEFAMEALHHPVPFETTNLGPGVNTPLNEAGPFLTTDEKYLYFTRQIDDGNYTQEDIYYSVRTDNTFGQANEVGDAINTFEYGEGSVCISASGKYLLFSSYDRPNGQGNSDIYISRKVGEKWERANNVSDPINGPGWEGAPSLSADGRTLFFSSVRSGGMGQRDIWVSYLNDDGSWTRPQNLGDSINTPFNDESPFIHPDGKTLFFSSNGWPGMGNYDLYKSVKLPNGQWSKAVNLGYPINTSGYEVSIFISTEGNTAYYSSERKDSYGGMDIYKFDFPSELRPDYTSYVKGNVFDNATHDALNATVQIYDLEAGKLYMSITADKLNGGFMSALPAGKNYGVMVQKDGYLFYSQNISLKNVHSGRPYELNIGLNKIKVGETVVLNNVFFESDQYDLKSESKSELEVIRKMLDKNPTLKIEIGGHTDNSGTDEKNKVLSENRAKSVYDYLVSKGTDATRLTFKGYASSKPVAPNDTAENKAKNRRTEFVVTAI